MIYKDFIAETAQKIMAAEIINMSPAELATNNEELGQYARGSVNAAKALADALEQDWQEQTAVDGIHRFSEGEPFFDSYVNWTKTK